MWASAQWVSNPCQLALTANMDKGQRQCERRKMPTEGSPTALLHTIADPIFVDLFLGYQAGDSPEDQGAGAPR